MLTNFDLTTNLKLSFDRNNLKELAPYFDIDFLKSNVDNKIQFFKNLKALARRSLGLAHCIQHNAVARVSVQLSDCKEAHDRVFSKPFNEIIGCYSTVKRSDKLNLENMILNGTKNWFSNLDQADFGVLQIKQNDINQLVYFDLSLLPCKIDYEFFSPIGMELARAGALKVINHKVNADHILGQHGTQKYFQQSNFANYCFVTNHCGLVQELFLDLKRYAEKFNCGTEFELKKLEMDVSTLLMQWKDNLHTLDETKLTNEFWNKRNTQYAFSKKTLISILQLILEIGVSYYVDAKSEFSQRFRDALTYAANMHPLCKFGQEFHMFNVNE
jgi:hypothetical protein